jgi:DNA-binding MarR family transcriptional regulator
MSTRWLTKAEQESWRLFVTVLPDLLAAFEVDLVQHGLVRLSESDEHRMRMCDLAAALRLSPSGLTRRLDGLVKSGWVERAASPDDRRVMYAHLTPRGMATLEKAAPDHVASVRRYLVDPIGADGMRDLGRIFATVRRTLEADQLA